MPHMVLCLQFRMYALTQRLCDISLPKYLLLLAACNGVSNNKPGRTGQLVSPLQNGLPTFDVRNDHIDSRCKGL